MLKHDKSRKQVALETGRAGVAGLLALIAVSASACTAEDIYRNVQQNHQRECYQLPVPQQAHCLSLNATSWEEYQLQRRQLESQGDPTF